MTTNRHEDQQSCFKTENHDLGTQVDREKGDRPRIPISACLGEIRLNLHVISVPPYIKFSLSSTSLWSCFKRKTIILEPKATSKEVADFNVSSQQDRGAIRSSWIYNQAWSSQLLMSRANQLSSQGYYARSNLSLVGNCSGLSHSHSEFGPA